jgi:hypothetical protein
LLAVLLRWDPRPHYTNSRFTTLWLLVDHRYPRKKLCTLQPPPCPRPLYFPSLNLPAVDISHKGILQHKGFGARLLSLAVMFSRLSHNATSIHGWVCTFCRWECVEMDSWSSFLLHLLSEKFFLALCVCVCVCVCVFLGIEPKACACYACVLLLSYTPPLPWFCVEWYLFYCCIVVHWQTCCTLHIEGTGKFPCETDISGVFLNILVHVFCGQQHLHFWWVDT